MASTARSKDRARNNAAIFSVVAIAILIAIPAIITYANDSNDVIHTLIDLDGSNVQMIGYTSGETSLPYVVDYDRSIIIDVSYSGDELHTITIGYTGDFSDVSRVALDSDSNYKNLKLFMFTDSWNQVGSFYQKNGSWIYDLSTFDRVNYSDATQIHITGELVEPVSDLQETFRISAYSSEPIFTSNVVENMALVSGLMLIVFALFATPWISVSQVTRTARKGARSVKNGAKKATRSVKRSVKKR